MTLRAYIQQLSAAGKLLTLIPEVSRTYELAGILKSIEPQPVLFEHVKDSQFRVMGNLLCSKAAFADYLNVPVSQLIPTLIQANGDPQPCPIIDEAPCQEVVIHQPDLDTLPILRHCALDGGNYISSGVFIARHPAYGQNLDFHRAMQFSSNEMAIRVVRGRHFDRFLDDLGRLDVVVCIGVLPEVLVAAATSVDIGTNELEIANAISLTCLGKPVNLVHAKTVDLLIPAEAEFVLEGTVYRERRHPEGPFVDLTGTYDSVRNEPVFEVKTITHRKDAIWHALLPGGLEHKLLMGMPREPTIFKKVNEVVRCLDVNINPGGGSWLHAIVQIDKQSEQDGKKAIQAAFAGHRSCKHVFVVDKDIDIYNPLEVEWALATRFQGEADLVMKPKEPGSSLDPSSERTEAGTYLTTKLGFDLTKPCVAHGKDFEKAIFPIVDIHRYLKD
ncbi:MAG TPA: UbiD family decarboxylase [Anaerolineales bacterium]|nr:UbiD family decarboxylase [Anaerolineales bacterium]